MAYWLMKSEPSVYGIDDLERDGITSWGGTRNYQVRNLLRDEVRKGDQAFFYHSSCAEPGIVGLMRVKAAAYPDPTQFDRRSGYYDPKSRPEAPIWLTVDVAFQRKLRQPIDLQTLRAHRELAGMLILRRGNRLSVTPVSAPEWTFIMDKLVAA